MDNSNWIEHLEDLAKKFSNECWKKINAKKNTPKKSISTPNQEIVSTPNQEIISTPKQEVVSTPKQEIVSTPKQEVVSTPKQEVVSTPKQEVVPEIISTQLHVVLKSNVTVKKLKELFNEHTNKFKDNDIVSDEVQAYYNSLLLAVHN